MAAAQSADCVSASLVGHALVSGLGDSLQVPALPRASRSAYGAAGSTQYLADATPDDIRAFYQVWLPSLCWSVRELGSSSATYAKGEQLLRLSWVSRALGERTVVNYETNIGRVLAATYTAAQTSCPEGHIWCTDPTSGQAGCYTGTSCPTYTPPPTPCPPPPSACPHGYLYDSSGCSTGCVSAPATSGSSCPADQVSCTGSSGGSWCQYPPCPSSTSSTDSSSSCPSGYYWCNGACTPNTTSCGTAGGYPTTQSECVAQSKTWCTSNNGGWCQTYPPCPSSTTGGSGTWPQNQAECSAQSMTWCTSTTGSGWCQSSGSCPTSGGGTWTACPADQWMCDGACISLSTACHGWYPNGSQTPGGTTACPAGQQQCPAGGCVAPGTPCPSTSLSNSQACAVGSYWCPASNNCVANTQPCGTATGGTGTPTNTVPAGSAGSCGQCKYDNNGQCVPMPQGTTDPACGSGNYCDGYGGCATIRPKYVADGALCPNKTCETKFGENRDNCPIDCGGVTVPTSQPLPTGSPYPGQFPGQGEFSGQPGQFPGGPGGYPGGPGGFGPGGYGPSEEEMKRMQEQQLEGMKRGMREARRGTEMMKREITRRERDAKRCGAAVNPEVKNALAAMEGLLAKVEAAQSVEEAMDAMMALQDAGETLRDFAESGFRNAPMLCEMKKRAPTELKRFEREAVRLIAQAKRVKNNEGLVELANELELKVVESKNQLAKALGLITTDPEAAVDAFEELWMIRDDGEHLRNALRAALDARRVLPELKRDLRRTDAELKRYAKSGRDVSEAQDLLEELKVAVADLDQGVKDKVGGEELVDLVQIVYAARAAVGDAMATFYGRGEYEPQVQIRDKAINFDLPDAFDRQTFGGSGGFGEGQPSGSFDVP